MMQGRFAIVFALAAACVFAQPAEFAGTFARSWDLRAGDTVEVSLGLPRPSQLPPNGRISVEWAGYRKVLHALDPDFYMVFRAAADGNYSLKATAIEDEEAIFNLPRWRESGSIQKLDAFPRRTPWPAGKTVAFRASVTPVDFGASRLGMVVEAEPNDSIASAQPVPIGARETDETVHITGGADDIEYFDNGLVGKSGDDWFRIEFRGKEPRLLTANLTVPDPLVVAQVQMFTADGKPYRAGANENERVHQQLEEHRTEISRTVQPGGIYFLRVEANSPGYEVELRIRRPAPYADPREAVRQAMYDHISQVDAWLLNRPRGASVERRIRDTGSLLGTHCMSCHTQSGVWGPAGPLRYGYRIENVSNYRHLLNVMYESLRPTNELVDAANNTSLAPLDLGDGPAGTRVAGYNATTAENVVPPRRLHSAQQIRAANFVLQSNDPSGVNAAGPGSNVGQAIVFRYTGEILRRAWDVTRDKKYLQALDEKAHKILEIGVKFSDDLSNRIIFVRDTFPRDYAALQGGSEEAKSLMIRLQCQALLDEDRLRQTQRADGSWGFDPGQTGDGGRTWKVTGTNAKDIDPAPTALALTALAAMGYGDADTAVARGVRALLRMQDSYGRWNRNALTGFVTTAYALHALARLYPENPAAPNRADFEAGAGEPVADTIARFRALAQRGLSLSDKQFAPLAISGASHTSPQVRYWAQIALGALHDERGVPAQIGGLGDPVKMVREAARWGMRQTLLDDKGWDYLFAAYEEGDDLTREAIAGALVMRADGMLTRTAAGYPRLTGTLDRMMNNDPHPAVRAWASRAAWNWWVWNPPVRAGLNRAFIASLEAPEPSALVETAKRYQTEALFIANGQRANGSKEHQYRELAELFEELARRAASGNELLAMRLTKIAGTFYSQAGGDGGPGQMGYVTPHASEMMGKAVLAYWRRADGKSDAAAVRLSVEAAANALYDPLQKRLLEISTSGPEALRTIAATSLADPRVVTLPGTQEFLEPLIEQVRRGAQEPERRNELVAPTLRLFARASWNLPKTDEQLGIFYRLMTPAFAPERAALEENRRELLQMEKESADWYLARSLGNVLHANPDLHTPALLRAIPTKFATPMDEMVWLPAVKWILTFGQPVPEVRAAKAPAADKFAGFRERIVDLYLEQFKDGSDRRLRTAAMALAPDTTVRRHPRIAPVLAKVAPQYFEPELPEVQALSPEWKRNFEYFRDWVAPELLRPNREDELACLNCHGVAGRVPSMELAPAKGGYLDARSVYRNYAVLLERVNENDVEHSKLLRKPLNVQTGKEDGHQGGRRYNPNDRGYEIIRRWALDSARLKAGS
jgi:hypothetical protein